MPLTNGDAFLMMGTGGQWNPGGAHLMVCISVNITAATASIVPIVSRHEYSDESCCLYQGDHPFLRHDSVADYGYLRTLNIADIEAGFADGQLKRRSPVRTEVLRKLQIGLVNTDEVSPFAFARANGPMLKVYLKKIGAV